jgi:transcriptional regulator
MHFPAKHVEKDIPTLRSFIRANPLGLITTAIDSPNHPLLQTSHVPFILDVSNEIDEQDLGVLRGHMARANPQVKAMIEDLTEGASKANGGNGGVLEREVLVLFNGSAHHYVTPKFYKETKPTTAKVVPTWNYSAVEVYGKARVYFDSKATSTNEFLDKQIADLSLMCEKNIMEYEKPWETKDAPKPYLEIMKKGIVGIEIRIERMGGKVKMSQEMREGDREGVIEGFEALGTDVAKEIAACVRARSKKTQAE